MELPLAEIEFALHKILEASTTGLEMQNIVDDEAWFLCPQNKDAQLHQGIALINPSKRLLSKIIAKCFELYIADRDLNCLTVPAFSDIVINEYDLEPYKKMDETFNGQVLVCDSRIPFKIPYDKNEGDYPVYFEKITKATNQESLILMMAKEFYPHKKQHDMFIKLGKLMASSSANDFIGFYNKEDDKMIGGTIVANYDKYCQPLYDFIHPQYRGRGYFYPIIKLFQKYALRKNNQYIIGELYSDNKSASLIRIFKGIGATVGYNRCYYSIN